MVVLLPLEIAVAQNPPTSYTPQTTPYSGTESWYCERVAGTVNGRCSFADLIASISSLGNLTSAPLLTNTGTITSGGASGPGFTLNLGTISYNATRSLPDNQLSTNYAIPIPVASGGTGTTNPISVAGNGIQITGAWPNNTIAGKTGGVSQNNPSNPSGTTSGTGVMMGLAGSITPTKTGTVLFVVNGDMYNSANGNSCFVNLRYGTGTPPANGSTNGGTVLTASLTTSNNVAFPFSLSGVAAGLALTVPAWFDVGLAASAGTCNISNISMSALEQ